jgi:hypothetical protein
MSRLKHHAPMRGALKGLAVGGLLTWDRSPNRPLLWRGLPPQLVGAICCQYPDQFAKIGAKELAKSVWQPMSRR